MKLGNTDKEPVYTETELMWEDAWEAYLETGVENNESDLPF